MRQTLINWFWHLPQAVLANLIYGFPSRRLTVIGITGTSGKTSTAHLLYHILKQNGFKVKLISTVSVPGLHVTNPDPFPLQKMIRTMINQGVKYLVLEVTSHGLDQWRNWGIDFSYGVLTNVTHEHLDYHKNMAGYLKAKLKLIRSARIAVLNQNDPAFIQAKKTARGRVIEFSDQPDFLAANFNAAAAVARDMGINEVKIKTAAKSFPGIPGRMETVYNRKFKVVIDFAHKPDALEKALKYLRRETRGQLIAVFGCAGLRDKTKRPIMGEIAGRLADKVILTAEDPRTENVNRIIAEIGAGCPFAERIPDRQEAIDRGVMLAKPGDVVALFGKAHEKSMCFGTIEYAWDEYAAVKQAVKRVNSRRRNRPED